MPVKAGTFRNDDRKQFRQLTREGMTIVIPEIPVSIIQNKKQLIKEGFSNFLIDLSFDNPSKNRFKTLITKFRNSELLQPSTGFNFKSGMK
jgi:putative protease